MSCMCTIKNSEIIQLEHLWVFCWHVLLVLSFIFANESFNNIKVCFMVKRIREYFRL